MNTELIFIYNAKSGPINGAIDYAHKLLSPQTYACELCALTYNLSGMRKKWKIFLHSLDQKIIFLHKDDMLESDFKHIELKFPCILWKEEKNITPLIGADEFKNIVNLDDLIERIKNKIKRV